MPGGWVEVSVLHVATTKTRFASFLHVSTCSYIVVDVEAKLERSSHESI